MRRDVLEEKLTPEYARREYGVLIDPTTGTVRVEPTARLRAERSAAASA